MKRICVLISLFFAINAGAQDRSVLDRKADSIVKKWMEASHTPGAALGVIRDGHPLYIQFYGMANVETGTPVTKECVFMIASISKQFIATAILLLAQEGKLQPDTPAMHYISELPAAWKDITVRQLLSHTSGLIRDPAEYHPYTEQPIMAVIRSMYNLPLNSMPGDRWVYSNAGYFVLAEIISRVSGESWDAFIKKYIFQPAGMIRMVTNSAKDIISSRISGYHQDGNLMINAENWTAVRPSGAFSSTMEDMIKWDQFQDTGHLLTEQNKKLMWTPAVLNNKQPTAYGFGWYVESFLGRSRIHHDGQYPGFRSDYERFADDHLHIIILTNADNRSPEGLALNIAGIYEPGLNPPPFGISVREPEVSTSAGKPVTVNIDVRNEGKAAPGSVVEMEIWNEKGQPVYKQNSKDQNFTAGAASLYSYSWTPDKPGTYTVNVGVYGPHWVLGYAWKTNLSRIIVK